MNRLIFNFNEKEMPGLMFSASKEKLSTLEDIRRNGSYDFDKEDNTMLKKLKSNAVMRASTFIFKEDFDEELRNYLIQDEYFILKIENIEYKFFNKFFKQTIYKTNKDACFIREVLDEANNKDSDFLKVLIHTLITGDFNEKTNKDLFNYETNKNNLIDELSNKKLITKLKTAYGSFICNEINDEDSDYYICAKEYSDKGGREFNFGMNNLKNVYGVFNCVFVNNVMRSVLEDCGSHLCDRDEMNYYVKKIDNFDIEEFNMLFTEKLGLRGFDFVQEEIKADKINNIIEQNKEDKKLNAVINVTGDFIDLNDKEKIYCVISSNKIKPVYGLHSSIAVLTWINKLVDNGIIKIASFGEGSAIYVKHENIWRGHSENSKILESFIEYECVNKSIIMEDFKTSADPLASSYMYTYLDEKKKTSLKNQIIDLCKGTGVKSCSNNFIDTVTEDCVNKVFYKNGYYDLVKKCFVPIDENKLIGSLVRVEKNFYNIDLWNKLNEEGEENEYVKILREKYLNVFGEKIDDQNWALFLYAMAMTGRQLKFWVSNISQRNSGKSFIQSLIKHTFGDQYITSFSAPVIKSSSTDSAMNYREIVSRNMYKARIAFSNESVQEKQNDRRETFRTQLDGNFLKACASGVDSVVCRGMRENEVSHKVTSKMFLSTNDVPDLSPIDAAETCLSLNFPYKFEVNNKKASNLPSLKKADIGLDLTFKNDENLICAFTWLIFNSVDKFNLTMDEAPQQVKDKHALDYGQRLNDTITLYNIFAHKLQYTGNAEDKLTSDEVYDIMMHSENVLSGKSYTKENKRVGNKIIETIPMALIQKYGNFLSSNNMESKDVKIEGNKVRKHRFGIIIKKQQEINASDEENE
jgi:hypothetical protein